MGFTTTKKLLAREGCICLVGLELAPCAGIADEHVVVSLCVALQVNMWSSNG